MGLAACQPQPVELPTQAAFTQSRILNYDTQVSGVLSTPQELHLWQFVGRQNDRATLRVIAPPGSIQVSVLSETGSIVAQNPDTEFTLPVSGIYTVNVTLSSTERAAYQLGLQSLTSATAVPPTVTPAPVVIAIATPTPPFLALGDLIGELTPVQPAEGRITDIQDEHLYIFTGERGMYVNLTLRRTSGRLDPLITLYDPEGQPLALDDDSGGDEAASLQNILLTKGGTYSVIAAGGGQSGDYRLVLQTSFVPQPTPTVIPLTPLPTPTNPFQTIAALAPAVSGNRLEDHQPVIGSFSSADDFDRYPIFASTGDIITIYAGPINGSAAPLLMEIYDPEGVRINAYDSRQFVGGTIYITQFAIAESGAYTLFITSANGQVGEYVVGYGLGSTYQNALRTDLQPDTTAGGEITLRGVRDVWSLFLNAGDSIIIAVTPVDRRLDPAFSLIAPDGAVIATDDNSGADGGALATNIRVGATGWHQLYIYPAQPDSAGMYNAVWRIITAAPTPTSSAPTGYIQLVTDTLSDSTYRFYPFQGIEGQRVRIRVQAEPGSTFDAVAVLLDPDGSIIAQGDDSEGSLDADFQITLPASTTYTLRVNGYAGSMGAFRSSVETIP